MPVVVGGKRVNGKGVSHRVLVVELDDASFALVKEARR